jgi:hypothetical protein
MKLQTNPGIAHREEVIYDVLSSLVFALADVPSAAQIPSPLLQCVFPALVGVIIDKELIA